MPELKWIKLCTDIFDDEKIRVIHSMPKGAELVIIWLRLLCIAGKCNQQGFLMLADNVPYNNEFLASLFRIDIKLVNTALDTFCSLGMIEIIDNRIAITNWLKYQSGDKLEEYQQKHREQQRRYREKLKESEKREANDVTGDVTRDVTNDITRDVTRDVTSDVTPSYSYSISNISLYESIKDNYVFNNYIDKYIRDWIKYKQERRESYKEVGLKSLLTQIQKQVDAHGANAVGEMISVSMANGYKGIVWDRIKKDKSEEWKDRWANA